MQQMLQKSSKDLITGQSLYSTGEGTSETSKDFQFMVKKLSPAAADFSGTMVLVDFPDADISFDIPAAVRADWRVTQHTDISVLFSAIQKPPVMGLVAPISPIVTVSLVEENGAKIELSDLLEPITIQIPISHIDMCPGEISAYSGKGTCMYWNKTTMQYSADGCTTEQSDSAKYVTCRCNHLTSFVVENIVKDEEPPSTTTGVATTSTPMPSAVKDEEPPYPRPTVCSPCPVGKFQTKPCSHTVDSVCQECPSNSSSPSASNSVTNCTCLPGHEGYKGEACTVCAAGKFKYAGEGACETCPSLTTSTMGAGNRSACLFPQVLAYF